MRTLPSLALLALAACATTAEAADLTAKARFACNLGQTIQAYFYAELGSTDPQRRQKSPTAAGAIGFRRPLRER